MKKTLRILWLLPVCALLLSIVCPAQNTAPYENYTYSEETGEFALAPQAYLPERVLYGADIGAGAFREPADLFCDEEGFLYILDTGNQRIVVLNPDFTLKAQFSCVFPSQGGEASGLNGAKGLFVDDRYIYVADSQNARIIVMNRQDGSLVQYVNAPVSDVLGEGFIFKPIRLAVDRERLLYVVSEGTYEGVINMDMNGNFLGFFGSNSVTASAWDLFWRRFATKEQRKTMLQLIPQDFSSIDMDSNEFFLTTTYTAQQNSMVKRLNPGGNDVIRSQSRTGLVGDPGRVWEGSLAGSSSFSDIASGPDNIYACLDYTRGKIFCYNNDGYLLYTFGALADQTGGFTSPVALTYLRDDSVAVLDTKNGGITIFEATPYAKAINMGTHYQRTLDYDTAFTYWQQALQFNQNCDVAHNAVGQVYYNEENYAQAMEAFQAAANKTMYSKAKKELRSQWIYENIHYIVGGVLLLVILCIALWIVLKIRARRKKAAVSQ